MPEHRRDEARVNPEHEAIAAALGSLSPRDPGVDLEAALFEAGRRAGRRRERAWQGLSVMLCATLLAVVVWPSGQPSSANAPSPIASAPERAPEVSSPPPSPPERETSPESAPDPPTEANYLRLRAAVLARGLEELPDPEPTAEPEPPLRLRDLLDAPRLIGRSDT